MSSNEAIPDANQAKHIAQVARIFLDNFSKPFDDTYSRSDFAAIYHPDIKWYDHAFHICRQGREAIIGGKVSFLHCNKPFKTETKAVVPVSDGVVLELIWIGRCANDIVRPGGEVAVVGTGREFTTHVCLILKIGDDGLVTRIDEYYNRRWDEGVGEQLYKIISGGNMKTSD